jgi:hypothetical protein
MKLLILAVAKNKTSFPLTLSILPRSSRNQQNTIESFVHSLLKLGTIQALTTNGFYRFCGAFITNWLKNLILLSIFWTQTVLVLYPSSLIVDKLIGQMSPSSMNLNICLVSK